MSQHLRTPCTLLLNAWTRQTRDYYNEGARRPHPHPRREQHSIPRNIDYVHARSRDVSNIDTSVNVFGQKNAVPFGVAPTAMQGLAPP